MGRGEEGRARSGILTVPRPDKTFDIFCIKEVWRAQSAPAAIWLHEMTVRLLPNKGKGGLSEITGPILGEANHIGRCYIWDSDSRPLREAAEMSHTRELQSRGPATL